MAALAHQRRQQRAAARWYRTVPAEPIAPAICDRLAQRIAARLAGQGGQHGPHDLPPVAGIVVLESRSGWAHLIGIGLAGPAALSGLESARHVMTSAVVIVAVDSAQVRRSDFMALPDRPPTEWVDEQCDGMVLRVVPSPRVGPVWVADTSAPEVCEVVDDGRRRRAG